MVIFRGDDLSMVASVKQKQQHVLQILKFPTNIIPLHGDSLMI